MKKAISQPKILKNFLEESQENGPLAEKKDKTETATGEGRRTRQEIQKWNQIIALKVKTGGRHQTSLASLGGREEGRGATDSPKFSGIQLDHSSKGSS